MTEYEQCRALLVYMLESYRDGPEVPLRRYVDKLMRLSLKTAGQEIDGKKLHNLIVLRYISSKKRAKKPICDALNIGRDNYEAKIADAIDRLMVLAFGVGGIDWDAPLTDCTGRKQAWGQMPETSSDDPPENELVGKIMELEGLKYELTYRLLVGMKQHIRENTELSAEERSVIIEAIKTSQARLLLRAVFDL